MVGSAVGVEWVDNNISKQKPFGDNNRERRKQLAGSKVIEDVSYTIAFK